MSIVNIDKLLPTLLEPSWQRGQEIGYTNKDWDSVNARYLFISPMLYTTSIGIPALTICTNIINSVPDALADWQMYPDKDITKLLRENEDMSYWSLQHRREFKDFDMILFSAYFELQGINIPHMLRMGRIPIRRWERGEEDIIVIIGGFIMTNPEPLSDFADLCCIGDFEGYFEHVHDIYKKHKVLCETCEEDGDIVCSEGYCKTLWVTSKEAFLHEVQREVIGAYVPAFYEVEYNENGSVKSRTKKYDDIPDIIYKNRADIWNRPASDIIGTIIPNNGDAGFSRSIEVGKGCTHQCRFPLAPDEHLVIKSKNGIEIVPISELYERDEYLEVKTPEGFVKIDSIIKSESNTLLEFKLSGGYRIKMTPDHEMALANGHVIDARDVTIKDTLLIDSHPIVNYEPIESIDLAEYLIPDKNMRVNENTICSLNPITGTILKSHNRYVKLDNDFGKWLGLLLSDGYVEKRRLKAGGSVIYADSTEENVKLFKDLSDKIFDIPSHINNTGSRPPRGYENTIVKDIYRCYIYSNTLSDIFYMVGKAFTKQSPPEFMMGNKEFHKGLIEGLIIGDGSLSEKGGRYIKFSSISRKLIYQFMYSCNILGVNPYITRSGVNKLNIEYRAMIPFFMLRELESLCLSSEQQVIYNIFLGKERKKNFKLGIVKQINEIQNTESVYCIIVNSETHLFSTAEGIVQHNCRLGFTGTPYRERSPDAITEAINERLMLGIKEVTFSAPNATEYSSINYLAKYCYNRGMKAIIQSERVDSICDTELNFVRSESGRLQTSIAIEAGNQHMRDRVNKECDMTQIKAAIYHIMHNTNYHKLKVMLMMNLPFETNEDTLSIADMVKEMIEYRDELYIANPTLKRLRFHFNVSPFIPAVHTPMQWADMNERKDVYDLLGNKLKGVMSYKFEDGNYVELGDNIDTEEGLLDETTGYRKRAKFNILGGDRTREMQVIFGRGDRRVGEIIYDLAMWNCDNRSPFGGYKSGYLERIKEYGETHSIPIDSYQNGLPMDAVLPWDFINVGVKKEFLIQEFQRMKDAEFRPTCTEKCNACGGCDFKNEIDGQVFARNKPMYPDYHIIMRPERKEELFLIEGTKKPIMYGLTNKGQRSLVKSLLYNKGINANYKVRVLTDINSDGERIMGKFYAETYIPIGEIPSEAAIKEMFKDYVDVTSFRSITRMFTYDVTDLIYEVENPGITQEMIDKLLAADEIKVRKWIVDRRRSRGRVEFDVKAALKGAYLDGDKVIFIQQMTIGMEASPYDYIHWCMPEMKEPALWNIKVNLIDAKGKYINKSTGGSDLW